MPIGQLKLISGSSKVSQARERRLEAWHLFLVIHFRIIRQIRFIFISHLVVGECEHGHDVLVAGMFVQHAAQCLDETWAFKRAAEGNVFCAWTRAWLDNWNHHIGLNVYREQCCRRPNSQRSWEYEQADYYSHSLQSRHLSVDMFPCQAYLLDMPRDKQVGNDLCPLKRCDTHLDKDHLRLARQTLAFVRIKVRIQIVNL